MEVSGEFTTKAKQHAHNACKPRACPHLWVGGCMGEHGSVAWLRCGRVFGGKGGCSSATVHLCLSIAPQCRAQHRFEGGKEATRELLFIFSCKAPSVALSLRLPVLPGDAPEEEHEDAEGAPEDEADGAPHVLAVALAGAAGGAQPPAAGEQGGPSQAGIPAPLCARGEGFAGPVARLAPHGLHLLGAQRPAAVADVDWASRAGMASSSGAAGGGATPSVLRRAKPPVAGCAWGAGANIVITRSGFNRVNRAASCAS